MKMLGREAFMMGGAFDKNGNERKFSRDLMSSLTYTLQEKQLKLLVYQRSL